MIVTRTPLRVSFCGGGTDMPNHFKNNGGCVVSTSIDKYTYITIAKSFHKNLAILKYSTVEVVDNLDFIRHPIFREVLQKYDIGGAEITSTSDVPSGTGLGSSSTFTVGLINAVRTIKKLPVTEQILAEEACDIEINRLANPIGKQDQYAAAYGGLNFIKFNKNDSVEIEPILLTPDNKEKMSDNLMMFYLGGTRSASKVLKQYSNNTPEMASKKNELSKIAIRLKDELISGNIDYLGKCLDDSWKIKKTLSEDVSNDVIDDIYDNAMNNGASGGKLLGAGGNGFMLFYVEKDNQKSVRNALSNYREMAFNFDETGSKVVFNDNY